MGSGKGYELAPFDPYAKQPKMSYKVRQRLGCASVASHAIERAPPVLVQRGLHALHGAAVFLHVRDVTVG